MNYAKSMRIRATFTDEVLGTASSNPELYSEYIASKAAEAYSKEQAAKIIEEENKTMTISADEMIDKVMTGFPRNSEGMPFIYNYLIKGLFKEAARAMKPIKGSETSKLKAHIKEIDLRLFVRPREIPLNFKGFMGKCERPLRASTAQGERIALAMSEAAPAGTTIEFTVNLLNKDDEACVKEWLDYGEEHGLGQWRNSGKGSFLWEELDEEGNVIDGNK